MSILAHREDEIVPLSGTDTSLLVVVAENPAMPAQELTTLLAEADPDIAEVARAIVTIAAGKDTSTVNGTALTIARAFLEWAAENRNR